MITMIVMILIIRRLSVWKTRNWSWPKESGNLLSSLKKIGALQLSWLFYDRWSSLSFYDHIIIILSWTLSSLCHHELSHSLDMSWTMMISLSYHHIISRIKHMAMIKAKREEVIIFDFLGFRCRECFIFELYWLYLCLIFEVIQLYYSKTRWHSSSLSMRASQSKSHISRDRRFEQQKQKTLTCSNNI